MRTNRPPCRRILVIEPDRDLRDNLRQRLEARGYSVDYARDEKTAFETLMRGELPNVILLELEMRDASGWRFLAHQKSVKALRKIPTLVYSSRAREPEEELLESLDRICERSARSRDERRSPFLHLPRELAHGPV